jgi:type II secretory ATPase GspE/PulE/Tfp pilus assembly ATPase PilB-like protein
MSNSLFGEILCRNFQIDREEIEKALKFQKQYGGRIGEILLHSGIISEEQIASVLSTQFNIKEFKNEIKDLSTIEFEPIKNIDPAWFITNAILPLKLENHRLFFLIEDPLKIYSTDAMIHLFPEYEVVLLIADERQYREILNLYKLKYFKKTSTSFDENEIEKLRDLADEAPIIKFVNSMINRAAEYRASDIHLENLEHVLKIRYRIDGVLHDIDFASPDIAPAVISRIKIMSNLDIGEKRRPQDGRIQVKVSGSLFDIRISTLPSIHGENIVMRLLEKENINYTISALGLEELDIAELNRLVSRNFGLVLITGPTGSGKSTTLYSILNRLNTKEQKIVTVEDPVEYQIEGITQINVREQIGLTFANILRNILRHDPDIIMIGEIRDRETAEIAIQASLTGHLVLATLHTNDSISAITRLVDMGVDDYLINSSLMGVIAQRLVRKVCKNCAAETGCEDNVLEELNIQEICKKYKIDHMKMKKGKGCENCANTGYRGRVGVFEILKYTGELKNKIMTHRDKDIDYLKDTLLKGKFKNLREDAILKCLKGQTTIEEVFRVT